MPFPQTPLPVYVDIAPGAGATGTLDSWDPLWVDITNDVRVAAGIDIQEGIPDEATQADPGVCTLTVNNGVSKAPASLGVAGVYSPRNALGTWYGKLAKGTPLRVRLQRFADSFTRTTSNGWGTSDSGTTWSSTNAAFSTDGTRGVATMAANSNLATSIVGAGGWDADITGTAALNAVPTGDNWTMIVNFRRATSSNTYAAYMQWTVSSGLLQVFIVRTLAGGSTTIATGNIGAMAAGPYKFRVKCEGGFVGFKVWPTAGSEPAAWTVSSSAEGAYTLDTTALGTTVTLQVARNATSTTTTGYWDDLLVQSLLFVGNVPEWPVRWDKSGNDATTALRATGVLRRLQQGKTPLRSPLTAYLDQFAPAGHWPLEDDSQAQQAASITTGVAPAYIYGTSPGGWSAPKLPGTVSQYTVDQNTSIAGVLPRMNISTAWSFLFTVFIPAVPAAAATIFRVRASGTIAQWDINISPSSGNVVYVVGTTADGTVLVNSSTVVSFTPRWVTIRLEVEQTGSTITPRLAFHDFTAQATFGITASAVTGSIGAPQSWALYGSTVFQAAAAANVVFYPALSPIVSADVLRAGVGFAGETPSARVARVAAQQGIRLDLLTPAASSTLMGPQPADTMLTVLADTAATDLGLLTEFRGGLRYRPRDRRYNQTARLTLDFAQGHIAEPPEPTDDDQRLRNDVAVSRVNGAQGVRAISSASIAESGLYDTEVQVNTSTDDVLLSHAGFLLYLGTWNEMRWPSITIDLARNAGVASFIERAISLDPGARTIVNNPPSNLPVGPLDLLVEAVHHSIGPYSWRIELTCAPYGPWRISDTADTGTYNRADLAGSTLAASKTVAAVGASENWTITNTAGDWNTSQVPYVWTVAGEQVTVTAISGTGTQTATVTRGTNGITKTHAAGETVSLANPMYVAL